MERRKSDCVFCGAYSSSQIVFFREKRKTENSRQILAVTCNYDGRRLRQTLDELDGLTSWKYDFCELRQDRAILDNSEVLFKGMTFSKVEEWVLREMGA